MSTMNKRRFVKYKTAAKRYDVCLPTLEKMGKKKQVQFVKLDEQLLVRLIRLWTNT